ncbi:heliorhodopsin HeR [Candidatus Dojkabacteria bacterium]|nr:heliorhodopsin HeR [Candidatus Dojkabacteria bacterium]
MKNLRTFNLFMGGFHLLQGILMVILTNDFKLPVNTSYLKLDEATFTLIPSVEQLTQVKLGYLVAGFLFLSAIAHFTISLPGIYEWYKRNLEKGINYARWIEYSFSSSVMIVVIALLVGVYDFSSLLLMFSLNATMILFGWVMEVHNQTTKKTNWTAFIMGCFAGIVPWVVVALYLFGSGEGESKAPDFVYYIFFSIFLFFNVFAINMFLQYRRVGKWKDYLWGEKVYIILSLVAKSLLAWQVFAGTLRPV